MTKAAKNSGNVASDSETLTIKTKGEEKGEVCIGERKRKQQYGIQTTTQRTKATLEK